MKLSTYLYFLLVYKLRNYLTHGEEFIIFALIYNNSVFVEVIFTVREFYFYFNFSLINL